MTNLAITSVCNRTCSYCFAPRNCSVEYMERKVYARALSFLAESDFSEVRLLGGEPTLHPDFCWFVEQALAANRQVRVFTNGLMEPRLLAWLAERADHGLALLVNVNPPETQSQAQWAQLEQTLATLRAMVTLGFNISSPSASLDFLLPIIDRCQLNRRIRVGLAHPCLDLGNQYLAVKRYRQVGAMVASFAQRAMHAGVRLDFDCGFVPCMFPQEAHGSPALDLSGLGTSCGPIPDILPDGSAIHCFPLHAAGRVPLSSENVVQQVRSHLTKPLEPYRAVGIFQDCAICAYRRKGQCSGGCLAAIMHRFRGGSGPAPGASATQTGGKSSLSCRPSPGKPRRREPAAPSARWVIPYIDQPLAFWEELHASFALHVREVYMPLIESRIGSGRPAQPSRHLDAFLDHGPFPIGVLVNPVVLPKPAKEIARTVIEALERLEKRRSLSSITVTDLELAQRIKKDLPHLTITASVLMDIAEPVQAEQLSGLCDVLVPATRIMRNLPALRRIKVAFPGRLRLMLNEGCLPWCPYRTQHFFEMGSGIDNPGSLCSDLLADKPWLRLTGSWVLPQHLHLYQGIPDELKLAGRVTLQDPKRYHSVLSAYVAGSPLPVNGIGGGPASPLQPLEVTQDFFRYTLECSRQCHVCDYCRSYYASAMAVGWANNAGQG